MATQQFATSETPAIRIARVHGDLVIRGWQRSEVQIKSDEAVDVDEDKDGITLGFDDDANLQIPFGSTVQIIEVDGDLSIQGIAGGVSIGKAHADADLREVGPLHIDGVDGDLSVRTVLGECRMGGVGGDASIVTIQGAVTMAGVGGDARVGGVRGAVKISGVGGDLSVSDVQGSVSANVGGDADLRVAVTPDTKYELRTGGDANVRIQHGASVAINVTAGGDILVRNLDGATQKMANRANLVVGAGEAQMSIQAGGDVHLRGVPIEEIDDLFIEVDLGEIFGSRAADFAQSVVTQIEAQVGGLARQLDEKLNSMGTSEEVATRIQEKIQNTLRRAEERLSEALRNVEASTAEAQRRTQEAQRKGKSYSYSWPPPPPPAPKPPKPTRTQATDEERAMVLRMVSEGKISVEQAEKLLGALNSGDD